MRRAPPVLVLLVAAGAALVVACASTTPHPPRTTHTPDPSVARCVGGAPSCITAPVCQYDEARQCEACICAPAFQTVQQTQIAPFATP